MNIWHIALSYIRQNLKRPVSLLLLVLGPLLLIFILAQSFSSVFYAGSTPLKMTVGYYSDIQLDDGFLAFTKQLAASGITCVAAESETAGKQLTAENKYQALLIVKEKDLELWINDNSGLQAGIIEGVFRNYLRQSNLYRSIVKYNAAALQEAMILPETDCIVEDGLPAARKPRALDYFGITILTMCIMFCGNLGVYAMGREKSLKTLPRIYTAPVKRAEFLAGSFIGIFVAILVQMSAVFLIAKFVFGIYYGENMLRVILLLISECFFALAFGLGIPAACKNSKVSDGLVSTFVPVLIFLGGGYMKLPDNAVFNFLTLLSPIGWVNKALFSEIYQGKGMFFLPAVLVCLGLGIAIMSVAAWNMTRRTEV